MQTTANKHLIALITFVALIPLVYFIPDYVAQFFSNKLLGVTVTVAIIVPIVSYLVIPQTLSLLKMLKLIN